MQEYEIRRGHFGEIEGDNLGKIITDVFGKAEKKSDGEYETSFGALSKLHVKLKDKKVLLVETTMDPKVAPDIAAETIKKYNNFLETATGFTSKERSRRLQKKAKEGKI